MSHHFWGSASTAAVADGDAHALDALPTHHEYRKLDAEHHDGGNGDSKDTSTSTPQRPSSKIKCLDGLRGVACFLVFNYHFLWPWTPLIMLGYGARPPKSPEPFENWAQLPIICLLHRGRPMVAIFFAISGYVLCRHIQRAIHQRRLDEAYRKLSSAVFRRIFRLYLPCTISMFTVALLAQAGVFRSEKAIYKGPDSSWINGTVTKGWFAPEGLTQWPKQGPKCPNHTIAVEGREGIADALGLRTPIYLNETIGITDTLCLNITSTLHMPAVLYTDIDKPIPKPAAKNATANSTVFTDFAEYHRNDPHNPAASKPTLLADGHHRSAALNQTAGSKQKPFTWVQLGGSWEEHPIIHSNLPKALANFTVVYIQWANPFNFGHMHPRHDPHTWTIPKELRGSMVLYTFLLGTASMKARWRLGAAVGLAVYAICLGYWDMGVFVGGMLFSEYDHLKTVEPSTLSNDDRILATSIRRRGFSPRKERLLRWTAIVAALYLLSYPDAAGEFTPGFRTLAWLAPRWYVPVSKWMFYQALGALLLVPCVLRSPTLRWLLESRPAQYLGRISFSFYLIHGPVLHSFGFWIMPRLFERFGRVGAYVIGWFWLAAMSLYLSGWFYRKVDLWSVGVGRRLERALMNS